MPETIFGLSIVEAIVFTVVLLVICLATYCLAGQATDMAMEMMPVVVAVIAIAVVLFIGLWLYRQGQWSMQ